MIHNKYVGWIVINSTKSYRPGRFVMETAGVMAAWTMRQMGDCPYFLSEANLEQASVFHHGFLSGVEMERNDK